MRICDYGCGQEAKYRMTNGKWCCSSFYSKCPEIRKKNSDGRTGKNKHVFYRLNSSMLCFFGCGKKAKYMTGQKILKPCCSMYYNQCSEVRRKNRESNIGKEQPKGKDSKLYGRKRPNQSLFMKKNNPMDNPIYKEKCIESSRTKEYKKNMANIVRERWNDNIYRKKYSETLIKKGLKWTDEEIGELKSYYRKVYSYTRINLIKFGYLIYKEDKPIGIGDEFYNIDHIYSISQGFKNNIKAEIIGNFVNLQLLPWKENILKRDKCWITIDELKRKIKNENYI